jgi:predicted nucleic acid-binding protein
MRFTVDSNILVYAVDTGADARHDMAGDLMARAAGGDCVLTVQSLAEFFHATTRKGKLSVAKAESFIERWRAVFPVHAANEDTLVDAIRAVRQASLSFWDAMLWGTAKQASCSLLLSEDMHDGQVIGGVRIINPFTRKNAILLDAVLPPV